MNRSMTDRLDMAARVQEFLQAHPYSDRSQATVAARFAERLAEAQELFHAEHSEQFAAKAAVRRRQELRRRLEAHVMRNVSRVGAIALREDAQVASRFTAPAPDKSIAAFVAQATDLLQVAREHQDALARHGLSRAQFAEFATGLTRFREAVAHAQSSRRQLGETRAALKRAVEDLGDKLQLLDVCNRARFEKDDRLLGLWNSVRKSRTGRRRGGSVGSEAPAAPAVTPPAVVVAPPPNRPVSPVVERPVSGPGIVPETGSGERPIEGRVGGAVDRDGDNADSRDGEQPPRDGGVTEAA